jgi:hypothetical protein
LPSMHKAVVFIPIYTKKKKKKKNPKN